MRRSWLQTKEAGGSRESQGPQRMRKGQEQVAAGSSRPGRSSTVSMSSSAKRSSSVSHIPLPEGKVGKRSSSTGRGSVLGERNSMMTPGKRESRPRQTDKFSTPLRMQTHRSSLAPTGMSSNRRTSEMKRISGRGSLIGAKQVKDTRNLADRKVKEELTRRLLDFLRQRQYPSPLTSKDFPPSSKEFVNIFNFLYSYIDHTQNVVIGYTKNEDEIIKVMKSLHYPGMLTKSVFKTIVPHSWPTVLGCLSYLCDVATIFSEKLLPNVDAICFPSRDENGLPTDRVSDDKIILDCLVGCFQEFNEGRDEFPNQIEDLRDNLMENLGVNMDLLRSEQQQASHLSQQLQEITSKESNVMTLKDNKAAHLSDIQKMEKISREMESRCLHYKDQIKKTLDRQLEVTAQIKELEVSLVKLKGNSTKSLGSHEVERNSLMVNERKRKIEEVKANMEEMDNLNWQKEIHVSRARGELEKIVRQVNSVLLQQDIQTSAGERLSLTSENIGRGSRSELEDLLRESKQTTRKLEVDKQNLKMKYEEILRMIENEKKSLKEKSQEVQRIGEEMKKFKSESFKEEEILDEKLKIVKTDLQKMKLEERGAAGGNDLAERLVMAQEKVKEVKRTRAANLEAGEQFVRSAMARCELHFRQCEELRQDTARKVSTQIQTASSKVKNILTELEK